MRKKMEWEKELSKSVLTGNTPRFLEIHRNDPMLLKRFIVGFYNETPLHVAALRGDVTLAIEIIRLCPDLAESLDWSSSLPLHLAAGKGCLEIVKGLILDRPETCTKLNKDGFSPIHLAVIKGRVEVVRELVQGRQLSAHARTDQGESLLHLCVKHCQFEVLDMLLESVDEAQELVNAPDEKYGNTILHQAVADKQTKVVEYLLRNKKIDINAKNKFGYTPLDVLSQSRRDIQDWEIGNLLQAVGAVKAGHIATEPSKKGSLCHYVKPVGKHNQNEWLSKKRDALMVVASLLAAMAFQAGVTPPGGVWQEDTPAAPFMPNAHRAGEAVVAFTYPETYKFYLHANTISFVASLSTILLLISGLPFKQRSFMLILVGIMWLSITSMAFTYSFSIVAVTPKKDRASLRRTMYVAVPVWCGVSILLFLGHTMNLVQKWLKKKGIDLWDHMRKSRRSFAVKYINGTPNV